MSFSFLLNTSFIAVFSFSASFLILFSKNYYRSTRYLLIIFAALLPLVGFFRPFDIADTKNILLELSGSYNQGNLKYLLISPLANLKINPEIKWVFLSALSSLITSLSLFMRLRKHHIHSTSMCLLFFSLYPLLHFHYRQYLSFSLACLFFSFYFSSSKTPKVISFILYPSIILAIYTSHFVYLAPIFLVLAFDLFFSQKFLHVTFDKFSIIRVPYLILIGLVLIFFFLFNFSILQNIAFLIVPQSYQSYITWSSEQSSSLLATSFKLLLFIPFILLCTNSEFLVEYSFKDSYKLRYLLSSAIAIISFIFIASLLVNLYSFQRLASSLYPLLILIPISHLQKFSYMRLVSASMCFGLGLFVILKSTSYHSLNL